MAETHVSPALPKNPLGSVASNGGGDHLEAKEKHANGGGKPRLTKEDLVAYLASGCKPKADWRSDQRPNSA